MKILVLSSFVDSDPARRCFYSSAGDGMSFTCVGARPSGNGRISRLLRYLGAPLSLRVSVVKEVPDLVVVENARLGLAVCLVFWLTGMTVPVVIWSFNILTPYRGLLRVLAKKALEYAAAAIVYSQHERTTYARHFCVPESKFHFKLLSGPYLEDERFSQLLFAPKEGYVVSPGYSGRDFALLAEVAGLAPSLRFIVLAYPRFLGGVSFPSNVEVRSGMSEVEYCRHIAKAQVCFLPVANRATANGHIAIVQAMSLKTLLVTNEVPGTNDYLNDGSTCIVIHSREPNEYADRLMQIIQSPRDYDGIVSNAYAYARMHFSTKEDLGALKSIAECLRVDPGDGCERNWRDQVMRADNFKHLTGSMRKRRDNDGGARQRQS